MQNKIDREQFETTEEYIRTLEQANVMHLERRQLQDLGSHYIDQAAKDEDFEMVRKGIYYYDLAMNMAASKGDAAMAAVQAVMQVLDDEQQEELDQYLAQAEQQHQQKAQTIADRMNARHEKEEEEKDDE